MHSITYVICLFVCAFVFILASTAKVISEHRPINVVSQAGIEPGTLRFPDNHEAHYGTEATCNMLIVYDDIKNIMQFRQQ